MANRCCVCGKRLTGTVWVCRACATAYGLEGPVSSWPDWARALKGSEKAERRYQATAGSITVPYDEANCEDLVYGTED